MARRKVSKPKKRPTAYDLVQEERERQRKAKALRQIDEFLAFTAEHPSVHDRMPRETS